MSNELLGKIIRWESTRFRLGYWVGMLLLGLISLVLHTGSVATAFVFFPLFGAELLENMPNAPIWLEAIVGVIVIGALIALMVWGLNPTRGGGLIAYTPQKYLTSVAILAFVMVLLMAGNGKVDMTEFEAYYSIFFASTMFPLMLFMRRKF